MYADKEEVNIEEIVQMDKLKEASMKNYTIWEIHCKYIGSNNCKRKLKKMFRKIARKKLKGKMKDERYIK